MEEDKKKICEALVPVLRMTRNLYNLEALEYNERRELVYARFASGYQKIISVFCDSGTAMIQDIINDIV